TEQCQPAQRQKGKVAPVAIEFDDEGGCLRFLDASLVCADPAEIQRVQELVVIPQREVGLNRDQALLDADRAAVFLAREGNLLAPQTRALQEKIHIFSEHFWHGVKQITLNHFEKLHPTQPKIM